MDVGEVPHRNGEVLRGTALGNVGLAPGTARIEKYEHVRSPVEAVFVVVARDPFRLGRERLAHLADQLDRAFVEADDRPLRSGCSA